MSERPDSHDLPWSVRPAVVNRLVYALYGLCALSVVLDFVIHRHEKLGFAESFSFYAWYGFVACVGLVVAAKAMRRVVMREENYYGEAED